MIKKLANGKYEITVEAGINPATGKRTRLTRRVSGRREDAMRLQDELEQKVVEGTHTTSSITLSDYLHEWFKHHERTVAPTTASTYEAILRLHLKPSLGGVKLNDLRPKHIQDYYDHKLQTLTPRSVEQHHSVLRRALEQAVRWGYIHRNVCDLVSAPRPARPTVTALSYEQMQTLREAMKGHTHEVLFTLVMFTGLRLGEVLGLRWQDIDLKVPHLRVTQTVTRVKSDTIIRPVAKTRKSLRTVLLPDVAAEMLKHHPRNADLVFHSDGDPLIPTVVSGRFIRLAKQAGIKMRFHDLRHTYATLLLSLGESPKIVQEILGHEDVTLTLNTYSHVIEGMQRSAIDKINQKLDGRTTAEGSEKDTIQDLDGRKMAELRVIDGGGSK